MSPEQAAGKDLDHRVDVYALAVIMFEMVTGRVPFIGDTFMGILTQHMFEDPPALADANPNIQCPDEVAGFIYRGLSKEPEQRYQDCAEMADALSAALAGRSVGSATYVGYGDPVATNPGAARPRVLSPADTADIPATPTKSNLGVVLGAVAVVLALGLGGAGWFVWQSGDEGDGATNPVGVAGGADAGLVIADPPPADPDAGAPQVEEDAGPRIVTLMVNTNPSGARVYVEGRGEVCSPSPCQFQLPASTEPITVRANAGRASAELQVIALNDMSLGPMNLSRGGQGGGRRRNNGGNNGNASSGDSQQQTGRRRRGGTNDLKIPAMFED